MLKRQYINEFLLPLYLFMFVLLRVPIVIGVYDRSYNTIVLGILAALILMSSVVFTRKYLNYFTLTGVMLIGVVLIILMLDVIFRYNHYTLEKVNTFIINGIIPILLFSQIRNYNLFLKNYVALSTITFILYFLDPINDYMFSFEYMIFGYEVMLPIFIGFYIAYKLYDSSLYGVLSIVSFILILIWGNRMAAFACIFVVLSFEVIFNNKTTKRTLYIFLFILAISVFFLNIDKIITIVTELLNKYNINSYSIKSFLDYLTGKVSHLSYGREVIWNNAVSLFNKKPLFGYGIGYFQNFYGVYVHNIFLDLLVSYGLAMTLLVILLLFNSFVQIFKVNGPLKITGVLFLCLSFPKLFTSVEFISEPSFWLLILYGFFVPIISKKTHEKINGVDEYEKKLYV